MACLPSVVVPFQHLFFYKQIFFCMGKCRRFFNYCHNYTFSFCCFVQEDISFVRLFLTKILLFISFLILFFFKSLCFSFSTLVLKKLLLSLPVWKTFVGASKFIHKPKFHSQSLFLSYIKKVIDYPSRVQPTPMLLYIFPIINIRKEPTRRVTLSALVHRRPYFST